MLTYVNCVHMSVQYLKSGKCSIISKSIRPTEEPITILKASKTWQHCYACPISLCAIDSPAFLNPARF
jgi:hypothetical protein